MILDVIEPSQVSAARRAAVQQAQRLGFDETKSGRVAIIVTEMATNLVKHAALGKIMISQYEDTDGGGLELLCLDKGGGIAELSRAMTDGFSTAGTTGGGLGAIERQSDVFSIFSHPKSGTAVFARVASSASDSTGPADKSLGAVLIPYPGETACGDSWAVSDAAGVRSLLVVDGSGHGILAERAAHEAVRVFKENSGESCTRIIEIIHRALVPTRGAAIAIARIDPEAQLVRFVGVGNISAAVVSNGEVRRMVSHNGTAGQVAPRIREFTYPYAGSPTVLMHSDGLSSKWDLAAYPGLVMQHPSVIAGVLARDFQRGRDDMCIVAMKG